MALIKCPECGGQVSDKADVCIHCGYPLHEHNQQVLKEDFKRDSVTDQNAKLIEESIGEFTKEDKESYEIKTKVSLKKKKYPIVFTIIIIFIVLIGGVLYYKKIYSPKQNYKHANELMKTGKYKDALEIFNNLENYQNSKKNILECEYQIAVNEMQDEANLESSTRTLEKLGDYKDSKKYLNDCYYKLGLLNYEKGNFEEALEYLVPIATEYDVKSFQDAATIMTIFEGDWVGLATNVEIDGWNITDYDKDNTIYKTYTINKDSLFVNMDNPLQSYFKDDSENKYYMDQNGQLVEEFNLGSSKFDPIILKYTKGEFSKTPKEEPKIGMTSDEVLNSTWGKPEDINKDTYSWGVREQWCYSDDKYIYLEDGVVTSISE